MSARIIRLQVGVIDCKGFFCKRLYPGIVDGRLWCVPESSQGLAIVDSAAIAALQ